jgi:hypothetical protein
MSEEREILVPAGTALDVLVLVAALPLAVFTLGCCLYFLIFPDSLPPSEGPSIPFLSRTASDLAIVCTALAATTVWLCARGFGALWRALDRRPMLVADADGLTFHPALCVEPAPWRNILRIRQAGWRSPYHLEILLRRRVWTVEAPWTSRRVRIGGLYLGGSGFVPSELISRLVELARRNGSEVQG